MIVFIDESGIHKQTGHSTTVVVYVQVEELEKIEKKLRNAFEELDIELFHWADQGWKVRQKFFHKTLELDFVFKIAIFKNPVDVGRIVETVFQHLITEKDIKKVVIDGKKPRWYENKLKKVLRDKGLSVKKLRTVRKEVSEPCLQLADFLAGLIRYSVDNPTEQNVKQLVSKLKKKGKLLGEFIF